jgi:hypothetical protein
VRASLLTKNPCMLAAAVRLHRRPAARCIPIILRQFRLKSELEYLVKAEGSSSSDSIINQQREKEIVRFRFPNCGIHRLSAVALILESSLNGS